VQRHRAAVRAPDEHGRALRGRLDDTCQVVDARVAGVRLVGPAVPAPIPAHDPVRVRQARELHVPGLPVQEEVMAEHDRTARPDDLAKHTPAVHREVPAFHPRHRLNLARPVHTPTRQSCICATRDRLPRGSSNTRPCRTYPAASKAPVATRTHARVGDLPLPQAPRRWGRGRRHAVGRPLCATSGHAGQSIGMHASNARHSAALTKRVGQTLSRLWPHPGGTELHPVRVGGFGR
jgi:hypothetical protein